MNVNDVTLETEITKHRKCVTPSFKLYSTGELVEIVYKPGFGFSHQKSINIFVEEIPQLVSALTELHKVIVEDVS